MATGPSTFDAFSWSSLLAGRKALVVDSQRPRALGLATALEDAGAIVTLAPGQAIGADRARDEDYSLAVLSLAKDEAVREGMAAVLSGLGAGAVILTPVERHSALRRQFGKARLGELGMSDRDLVMFIIGTPDE